MKLKIFIILSILIPSVFFSFYLYQHKDTVFNRKSFVEKQFMVEGVTCEGCIQKIKDSFKDKYISVFSYDLGTKQIVLRYDQKEFQLDSINSILNTQGYSIKLFPKDTLEVVDFKLKYN